LGEEVGESIFIVLKFFLWGNFSGNFAIFSIFLLDFCFWPQNIYVGTYILKYPSFLEERREEKGHLQQK